MNKKTDEETTVDESKRSAATQKSFKNIYKHTAQYNRRIYLESNRMCFYALLSLGGGGRKVYTYTYIFMEERFRSWHHFVFRVALSAIPLFAIFPCFACIFTVFFCSVFCILCIFCTGLSVAWCDTAFSFAFFPSSYSIHFMLFHVIYFYLWFPVFFYSPLIYCYRGIQYGLLNISKSV